MNKLLQTSLLGATLALKGVSIVQAQQNTLEKVFQNLNCQTTPEGEVKDTKIYKILNAIFTELRGASNVSSSTSFILNWDCRSTIGYSRDINAKSMLFFNYRLGKEKIPGIIFHIGAITKYKLDIGQIRGILAHELGHGWIHENTPMRPGKRQEYKADEFSVKLLHKLGYKADSINTFFEKIKGKAPEDQANWLMYMLFSEHPRVQYRMDQVNHIVKTLNIP